MNLLERFFSKYSSEKIIGWFRRVCHYEAISWALLFGAMVWIRMDREHLAAIIFIIIIGNVHGLMFTLYLLLLYPARKFFKWDDEDSVFAVIAAFFPFATIWVEKKLAQTNRE